MPRTSRREKQAVIARDLKTGEKTQPFAGRMDRGQPFKIVARFATTSGLTTVAGRDTIVHVSGPELAAMIGAIPALCFPDEEDGATLRAFNKTMDFLRQLDDNPDPRAEYR